MRCTAREAGLAQTGCAACHGVTHRHQRHEKRGKSHSRCFSSLPPPPGILAAPGRGALIASPLAGDSQLVIEPVADPHGPRAMMNRVEPQPGSCRLRALQITTHRYVVRRMGRRWYQVKSGSGSLAVGGASANLGKGRTVAAGQFVSPWAAPWATPSPPLLSAPGGRLCRRQVMSTALSSAGQPSHYSPSPPAGKHAARKFWRDTKATPHPRLGHAVSGGRQAGTAVKHERA